MAERTTRRLINHALSFAVPVTNKNAYVNPATHNDGALENRLDAIPEGTLIRINNELNIDAMTDIGIIEKIIYKAIQKYGMYCGDINGTGLSIRGVAAHSLPKGAYPPEFDLNNPLGNYYLKNFPFDYLEVIYTGPLQALTGRPHIVSRCAVWK